MVEVFTAGDVALLDQSLKARTEIEDGAFYVVQYGTGGIIRRLEVTAKSAFAISEDSRLLPSAWQRIPLEGRTITQIVRARAHLVSPACEWI